MRNWSFYTPSSKQQNRSFSELIDTAADSKAISNYVQQLVRHPRSLSMGVGILQWSYVQEFDKVVERCWNYECHTLALSLYSTLENKGFVGFASEKIM